MKKIVRLTESDLVRLVNKVLNEQDGEGADKGYSKDPTERFINDFLIKRKGFKKMFNFPKEGSKFCTPSMMGHCGAYQKGNQIIIVGHKGYCYFMTPPQGQSKNGPFTYKECMSFIG